MPFENQTRALKIRREKFFLYFGWVEPKTQRRQFSLIFTISNVETRKGRRRRAAFTLIFYRWIGIVFWWKVQAHGIHLSRDQGFLHAEGTGEDCAKNQGHQYVIAVIVLLSRRNDGSFAICERSVGHVGGWEFGNVGKDWHKQLLLVLSQHGIGQGTHSGIIIFSFYCM